MSSILNQRIAARDWNNIAKMQGRSPDAVRAQYDSAYLRPVAEPVVQPMTERMVIITRLFNLGWSRKQLGAALGYQSDMVRKLLAGEGPLPPLLAGRIDAILRHAEAAARSERAA